MAAEQTLRRSPALCSLEDPHSYSQASMPEGLMEPAVSAGLRRRNVDIERGEQSYKVREGRKCVQCYFCSNVISNVLVFQLVEQCQCRKTLLRHATSLLPICIFLDSLAISVGLANLSLMTVLSCFRLGFVLPITQCNTMSFLGGSPHPRFSLFTTMSLPFSMSPVLGIINWSLRVHEHIFVCESVVKICHVMITAAFWQRYAWVMQTDLLGPVPLFLWVWCGPCAPRPHEVSVNTGLSRILASLHKRE